MPPLPHHTRPLSYTKPQTHPLLTTLGAGTSHHPPAPRDLPPPGPPPLGAPPPGATPSAPSPLGVRPPTWPQRCPHPPPHRSEKVKESQKKAEEKKKRKRRRRRRRRRADLGSCIEAVGVGLEEAKGQGFKARVIVGVDHEGGTVVVEESEYSDKGRGEVGVEGARGGRIGLGEDGHGVDGGDLYGSSGGVDGREGGVEVLHGGEEVGVEGGITGVEGLVADRDGVDGGGGDEREDVGGDPVGGDREVSGEGGDVTVGSAEDERYVGAGEGPDDVQVGIVHSGLFDGAWPSPMPYQPTLSSLSPSLPRRLPPSSPTNRPALSAVSYPSSPSPFSSLALELLPSSAASPIEPHRIRALLQRRCLLLLPLAGHRCPDVVPR